MKIDTHKRHDNSRYLPLLAGRWINSTIAFVHAASPIPCEVVDHRTNAIATLSLAQGGSGGQSENERSSRKPFSKVHVPRDR